MGAVGPFARTYVPVGAPPFCVPWQSETYTLCASGLLEGEASEMQRRPAQKLIDHHANAMSREFGSNSRHSSPGTFCVVFGQVQWLLQLSIDRLADET